MGASVMGPLLEAPEEPFLRGGDPGLAGERVVGDACDEGPLLLASLSMSAERVISGLA